MPPNTVRRISLVDNSSIIDEIDQQDIVALPPLLKFLMSAETVLNNNTGNDEGDDKFHHAVRSNSASSCLSRPPSSIMSITHGTAIMPTDCSKSTAASSNHPSPPPSLPQHILLPQETTSEAYMLPSLPSLWKPTPRVSSSVPHAQVVSPSRSDVAPQAFPQDRRIKPHVASPSSPSPIKTLLLWSDRFAFEVSEAIGGSNATVMMTAQGSDASTGSSSSWKKINQFAPEDIIMIPNNNRSADGSNDVRSSSSSSSSSLLGSGTFANVSRVMIRNGDTNHTNCGRINDNNQQTKQHYALKTLRQDILSADDSSSNDTQDDVSVFIKAAQDLVREGFILSKLGMHPHIVTMRGSTSGGASSYNTHKRHDAFFLVLELLEEETLEDRIRRWKSEEENNHHRHHQGLLLSNSKDDQMYDREIEQLTICRQVANALEYIHSKNIVYRDLKPSNIGFAKKADSMCNTNTTTVQVKLMDFGLAREVPRTAPSTSTSNPQYTVSNVAASSFPIKTMMSNDMTGMVGTIRYMSPEVFTNQPYSFEADVYSWSIVSYEVLTKQHPFENMIPEEYHEYVCQRGVRPHCWNGRTRQVLNEPPRNVLPMEYMILLAGGWRTDPRNRSSLKSIQHQLDLFIQRDTLLWEANKLLAGSSLSATTSSASPSLLPQHFPPCYADHHHRQQQRRRPRSNSSSSVVVRNNHRRQRLTDADEITSSNSL